MTYSSIQRTPLFTDAEGLGLQKRKIIHTFHTKREMKVDMNIFLEVMSNVELEI